jgi:ArsR family transcriptional regulator
MRLEDILNILGNETRREILQMLSESPCYISQISQELNIGQKAIIEHLELMRGVGIIDAKTKKIEKGRPRKYYGISQDFTLEINISPSFFDMGIISPTVNEELLNTFPNLKKITEEIEELNSLKGNRKIRGMEELYRELMKEREKINEAKKIIEYLMGEIRDAMREEIKEEETRKVLF